jgi:hypothetical protein
MHIHERKMSDSELIEAIRDALPLKVQLTKRTADMRDGDGKRLTRCGQTLTATHVLDGESLAGITLAGMDRKSGRALAISLTGVRVDPRHPLYKEIRAYQLNRLAQLASERQQGHGGWTDVYIPGSA